MTSWMLSTLKSNLPRFVQSPNVIVSMPLSFEDEEREEFMMIADSVYYFAINAFGSSPNSARFYLLYSILYAAKNYRRLVSQYSLVNKTKSEDKHSRENVRVIK